MSDAAALFAEYEANEVKADQDFKNKRFAVRGIIASVGKDVLGTPYVALRTENPVFTVQCVFTRRDEPTLARLSAGQTTTIAGTGEGKMGNVLMTHCWFYNK